MAAERRELREALDDASAQLTLMREAGVPSARLEGNLAKIEAALGANRVGGHPRRSRVGLAVKLWLLARV